MVRKDLYIYDLLFMSFVYLVTVFHSQVKDLCDEKTTEEHGMCVIVTTSVLLRNLSFVYIIYKNNIKHKNIFLFRSIQLAQSD